MHTKQKEIVDKVIEGKMDSLTIKKTEIIRCKTPAEMNFSFGTVTEQPFTICLIHAEDLTGVGEMMGSPSPYAEQLAESLCGSNAFSLDKVLPETPRKYEDGEFNLLEMLSMALYDLVGKTKEVPMHALLGGAVRKEIPLMACIFAKTAEDAAVTAENFISQGFKSLKVKLFGNLETDCAIVSAVRSVMPDGYLQGDANQGYKGIAAGREAIEQLGAAGLDMAEDPFDGTFTDYAAVTSEFDKPVHMLDAPTRGWEGIEESCKMKGASVINLHPNCQGPFSEILKRAEIAQSCGIKVMVGGTGYAGIGTWAHAQLASVIGADFPYGDICGARDHGFPESSAVEMLPIKDGCFYLSDKPGHGGELNMDVIEKYRVRG
jgi:L-alanine-DL-glutamate epimerase-like enolase superfamily enzyme